MGGAGGAPEPDHNTHVPNNNNIIPVLENDQDNIIIRDRNNDSDDDNDHYMGYEPLAQGPLESGDSHIHIYSNTIYSDDDDEDEDTAESDQEDRPEQPDSGDEQVQEQEMEIDSSETPCPAENIPVIDSVDKEVTREVWGQPRENTNIQMDATKAQEVMSAMANFTLPSSSFPEWAHNISEEEWKLQLALKINNHDQSNR